MKTTLKILTIAGLAAMSLTASAKVKDGQKFDDWTGICQDNECGVIQAVGNDQGRQVGQILIRKLPEASNNPVMFVAVPLGVNLRAGISFTVDGKELFAIPYDFCTEGGCNAAAPLQGDVLAKVKAGSKLQATILVGDQPSTIGFSLKGVTKAINSL